jgi:two-component system phosphate regulon sensor histidine kinase PhoR
MIWPIAASVLLTIMIVVIFCYASILGARNQQSYYDIRTKVLKNMLQQLETPLSTMSVAAEALRNARVMQDAGKMNYYQRVINEENKRMNEQVEKFLREIK